MFKKYMHVERFGTSGVDGIELGDCYIFPKIDGTNGSVWLGEDGGLKAGSRNRQLSSSEDNAGFWAAIHSDAYTNVLAFLQDNSHLRLYGEWLVPHTLKTYRTDAWRKFYVFDVFSEYSEKYLSYDHYSKLLDEYDIEYIHPLCIIKNPHVEKLIQLLDSNTYLLEDGKGFGEGIVIKNYDFKNRFGRTVWAKIVRNEFKEKHSRNTQPISVNQVDEIETKIVDEFVTTSFVEKTHAKLAIDGWSSKMIPQLLGRVFHDLVTEEIWQICRKYKMPKIDFKRLNKLTVQQIKTIKPELF